MKILTVIVPSYNMERYLPKCLGSLIVAPELMERLEVLVVNDGSTDRTSEIAHDFAAKWPGTFRVIDKENGHYGSCVNAGLAVANGFYIRVLDADDHYRNTAFESYLRFVGKAVEFDAPDVLFNDTSAVNIDDKILGVTVYNFPTDRTLGLCDLRGHFFGNSATAFKFSTVKGWGYRQTEGCAYTDTEWWTLPFMRVKTARYVHLTLTCTVHGREGQTMDRRTFANGFGVVARIVLGISRKLLSGCEGSTNESLAFVRELVLGQITNVYSVCVLGYCGLPVKCDVMKFDEELKLISEDLYREASKPIRHPFWPLAVNVVDLIRKHKTMGAWQFRALRLYDRAVRVLVMFKHFIVKRSLKVVF